MPDPLVNDVVVPTQDDLPIKGPHRVLRFDRSIDSVVLISVEANRKDGQRVFFTAPRHYTLNQLSCNGTDALLGLKVIQFSKRPLARLSDDQLNRRFCAKPGADCYAVKTRKRVEKWLAPWFGPPTIDAACASGNPEASPTPQIGHVASPPNAIGSGWNAVDLFDPHQRAAAIAQRAKELEPVEEKQERMRRRLGEHLNQWWAGGCTRDALTPFTQSCGARGKRRVARNGKQGRRNALTNAKIKGKEGFVRTDEDDKIITYCWRTYLAAGETVETALRHMWDVFYSNETQDDNGKVKREWFPVEERPTQAQFEWNGEQQDENMEAYRLHLSDTAFQKSGRALPSTSNADIAAVGQLGAIDSSSPDVEYVSILDPLRRIGRGNRMLLLDGFVNYMAGSYFGLEPASSKTVALTVLDALTPVAERREELEDLGLDPDLAQYFLPIYFTLLHGDNTDTRTMEVRAQLLDIDTRLANVAVARSDMNPIAESGHHKLHRYVDHKLVGTTFGRRRERGEAAPDVCARLTMMAHRRESLRAQYAHNIMPLDPSIVPTAMKRLKVPATRFHMTKWAIDHGMVARSPSSLDLNTVRMKLLPLCRGTFTEYGVKLLRSDTGGQPVHIPRLRYVSDDPRVRSLMEQARRPSHLQVEELDDDFLVKPTNLRRIWWVDIDTGDLVQLSLVSNDEQLVQEATIYDVVDMANVDTLARSAAVDEANRIRGDIEAHQRATNKDGEDAHRAAVDELPKPPSKTALVANKKENREAEKAQTILGIPIILPSSVESRVIPSTRDTVEPTARPEVPVDDAPDNMQPLKVENLQELSAIDQSLAERRKRYGD